jgi:hypothetical protein
MTYKKFLGWYLLTGLAFSLAISALVRLLPR